MTGKYPGLRHIIREQTVYIVYKLLQKIEKEGKLSLPFSVAGRNLTLNLDKDR